MSSSKLFRKFSAVLITGILLGTVALLGGDALSNVNLDVPFLHQCCDTPADFDGRHACGATSAVMILAYYNIFNPASVCGGGWGNCVSKIYTYNGHTWNILTNDASGHPAYGAYGYIHHHEGYPNDHRAWAWRAKNYFDAHGLESTIIFSPTEEQVRNELDAGYPVWASTGFWGGHIVVIRGYTSNHRYYVNDPWPEGTSWSSCQGENEIYTWDQMGTGDRWIVTARGETAVPIPTSPGSSSEPGPVIDTLTPTLRWDGSSGADYYALAISRYPYGSENIIYNPQQVYGNSLTVPSGVLEYGQKYRWNMQAHNSAGWSAVSNTLYFQTPALTPPTLISPPNNSHQAGEIIFQWNSVPGATNYRFYLRPPSGSWASDETTSTSYPYNPIMTGGYHWKVKAYVNGSWSDYSDEWVVYVDPLSPPTLISPWNGSEIDDLRPTFQWNAVSGANYYQLQLATDSSFTDVIRYNLGIYGTSWQLDNQDLTPGETYYWKVSSANPVGEWSTVWHFSITAPQLCVSPSSYDFGTITQGSTPSKSFTVTNCGSGGTLNWNVTNWPNWLDISNTSGTNSGSFTATVKSNASLDSHSGIIHVSSNDGSMDIPVSVNIQKQLDHVTVSGPSSVQGTSGNTASYTCTAYFTDSSSSNVTSSATWTETFAHATISSGTLTVSSNLTSNESGQVSCSYTYNGVTKSNSKSVTLNVVGPPAAPGQGHRPIDHNSNGAFEDVNGDGTTDYRDYILLARLVEGLISGGPAYINSYGQYFDFNNTGSCNYRDYIKLARIIEGLEPGPASISPSPMMPGDYSQAGIPQGKVFSLVLREAPQGLAVYKLELSVARGRINGVRLQTLTGIGVKLAPDGRSALIAGVDFSEAVGAGARDVRLARIWVSGADQVEVRVEELMSDEGMEIGGSLLGVEPVEEPLVVEDVLAYPNPVTGTGEVHFVVEGRGIAGIQVMVYDLSGKLVYDSGVVMGKELSWGLIDNAGERLANGVYLYLVIVKGVTGKVARGAVGKLVILTH